MHRVRSPFRALVAGFVAGLGALLGLAACEARAPATPATAPLRFAATQVPAGVRVGLDGPEARYPIGSRLVLGDAEGREAPVLLSDGLVAAGGAAVSYDGRRILFTGREAPGARWRVYEADPSGGRPRAVSPPGADAFEPAWLPDGRVAFAARTLERGPRGQATALFVGLVGGEARRITFGAGYATDPCVLADGRLVFVSWRADPAHGDGFALVALHPDGTGAWALAGTEGRFARLARPRARSAREVVYLAGTGDAAATLRVRSPSASRPVPAGAALLACEPVGEDAWVLVASGATGGLVLLEDGVSRALPAPKDGWRVTHAAATSPRPRPQGHLSTVDLLRGQPLLLALDARPPGVASAARVRLTALDGPYADGVRPPGRVLGDVAIDADGSFFARVVPDAPLRLDVVDATGRTVGRCAEPFWVRPGEVRTCVGCHHEPTRAPDNRRPLAVGADPVTPLASAEGP